MGQRRRGGAGRRRERQRPIDELVDRAAFGEIQPAQPVGDAARRIGDEAARRRVRRADLAADQELRPAAGRGIGRILDADEAGGVPVAIDLEDAVAMRDLAAQQDVAAPARKRHPTRDAGRIVETVAFLGDAAVGFDLQPLIFVVEDEVDHPRDRIRAISRRGAAGHYLDARDQGLRNGVDVDQPGDRRTYRAPAVDQDQRAFGAQISKVEGVDARLSARNIEARVGRTGRAGERRQRVDEIGDVVRRRAVFDLGFAQHRQRRRRLEPVAHDARTGNDDLVGVGGFDGVGRRRRLLRQRRGAVNKRQRGHRRAEVAFAAQRPANSSKITHVIRPLMLPKGQAAHRSMRVPVLMPRLG